ncbi:MAG: M20 metallopeptidase family protein [Planctomycetota bacterium]
MRGTALARRALKLASSVEKDVIRLRREIHRHPEVGFEEVRTTGLIADYLSDLGLDVVRPRGKTGAIARIVPRGAAGRRPALALRADMDALPMGEATKLPFRSEVPGKGHLCGHDAHAAMLLGAAAALAGQSRKLPRPVNLVFQPAEECIPNGAPVMIAAGALKDAAEIYGLHVGPDRPVGTLALRPGPMMASMDSFEMTVNGRGGHGAMPHATRDPVVASAAVISSLQTVVSRRTDPIDPAVVSVCTLEAPGAFNVIPSRVKMSGTSRSLSESLHRRLPKMIRSTAAAAARAHGCSVRCRYRRGTPVLVNSRREFEKVARLWRALIAAGAARRLVENRPTMGGEDFAYYLRKVPGCFAFLGAAPRRRAGSFHNPRFTIDERALRLGVALHLSLALEK